VHGYNGRRSHRDAEAVTMGLEAVIFDMDGVLVDSEPLYDLATTEFLRRRGVAADPRFYDTLRGLGLLEVWAALADRYRLSQSVEDLAVEATRDLDRFFGDRGRLEPMPGARELVMELAMAGSALAVASSSPGRRVADLLGRLGLARWFAVVVSGDEVRRGKPDPEIFLTAARRLGLDPEGCAVVEDSERGVAAALDAGMRCVGLDRGQRGQPDLGRAHLVVPDLRQLTVDRLRAMWDGAASTREPRTPFNRG
jgi:HAD superfamily hydrolase (TIGR01509 family)